MVPCVPLNDEQLAAAKRRVVGWLVWHERTNPAKYPTREALAEALGVSPATLSYVMSAKPSRQPGFKLLLNTADLLGLPVDALVTKEPPEIPANPQEAPSPAQSRERKSGGDDRSRLLDIRHVK